MVTEHGTMREITVQMSEPLYVLLQAELRLCGCQAGSFCRNAIAKEVNARRIARAAATNEAAGSRSPGLPAAK
jgi:hypothetical protein